MFTENLSAFFNEHADPLTYTPPGYAVNGVQTTAFMGIFDANAIEVELSGQVNVRGVQSVMMCDKTDVPGIDEGARIGYGNKTYYVNGTEEDQTSRIVTAYLTLEL